MRDRTRGPRPRPSGARTSTCDATSPAGRGSAGTTGWAAVATWFWSATPPPTRSARRAPRQYGAHRDAPFPATAVATRRLSDHVHAARFPARRGDRPSGAVHLRLERPDLSGVPRRHDRLGAGSLRRAGVLAQLQVPPVSYTHLRAHETDSYLVCRLLLE